MVAKELRLDLMKLDTEGTELDVLVGAQRTIEDFHPDIIMEVILDGSDPPDGVAWLVRQGYRIFDLTSGGPLPMETSAFAGMRNLRRSAGVRFGEVLASTRSEREISVLGARIAEQDWPC